MALDVTVYNTFPSGGTHARNAEYDAKRSDGGSIANGTLAKKNQGQGANHSDDIPLSQNDYLEIAIKDENETEQEFQVGLKALTIDDAPTVIIKRSENTWTLTNIGTNTGAQVGVGPDGQ